MDQIQFKLVGGVASNSASPTDVWILEDIKTDRKYVGKLFISSSDPADYGGDHRRNELLQTEAETYKYILEKIPKNSMFFVRYIDYRVMDINGVIDLLLTNKDVSPEELLFNLRESLRYMVNRRRTRKSIVSKSKPEPVSFSGYLKHTFGLLILPYITGKTMYSFFSPKHYIESCAVSSALLFATSILAGIGVSHSDMHWDNIFVAKGCYPHYYIYYKSTLFKILSRYVPLLFDYDRSTRKDKPNEALERYEGVGNCIKFHENIDLMRFVCKAREYFPELLNFIKNKDFQKMIRETATSCYLPLQSESAYCRKNYMDSLDRSCIYWMLSKFNASERAENIGYSHPFARDIRELSARCNPTSIVQYDPRDLSSVERLLKKIHMI